MKYEVSFDVKGIPILFHEGELQQPATSAEIEFWIEIKRLRKLLGAIEKECEGTWISSVPT